MLLRLTVLLIAMCATLSMTSSAPAQTLEDAERELKAAKAEQARRETAARTERERKQAAAAAAERKQREAAEVAAREKREREAAAAAAAARSSSLVLRSDAACSLSINAADSGAIDPGETRKLDVPAGEVLLECTSIDDPTLKYSEVKRFEAQQNAVVLIELQAKLAAAEQQRQAAAAKLREQEAQAAAEAAKRTRFVLSGDGMLQDTQTGLYWSEADNGSNINWNNARKYCAGKEMALPSVEELSALFDPTIETACGSVMCHVTGLFRLSSFWFWSNSRPPSSDYDSEVAWSVFLNNGGRVTYDVSESLSGRALCVRRS